MTSLLAKAPWASSKESSQDDEEGESLTTILSTEEDRSALTLLIADCTEAMRQSLVDVFDAKQTGQLVDTVIKPDEESSSLVDATAERPDTATDDKIKEEQDQANKELAQREKELNVAKLQDTKAAALQHFDEWRANVIQRVGEIVNSRETAEKQKENAKPKEPESAVSPKKFPDLPEFDEEVQNSIQTLYPPIEHPLKKLPKEKRALILHSVLLLLLSLEHYYAESRILLLRLSTSLELPVNLLAHDEGKVARTLLVAAESMQAEEERKKNAEENKNSRKWKVGLATVAGAALIGVTGGLAAPLLAAGLGTVMGGLGLGATAAAGYLGTLAGSSVLVGGLFGAYGGRMTGKMMDQYSREVEDFAFIPVRNPHKPRKIEKEFRRLRVGVGISGWLTEQPEVVEPWKVIGTELETFALQWELEALMNLGNSMVTMVKSAAWDFAKMEIIKRTVFYSLAAGLWPLGLLKVRRILDNPFSIANARALKAGEVLADAIINKAQGERPLTLVGYSLGAKVIFSCLQRLAERKAFGLVESAVLVGTPAPSTAADWRMIKSVVAGRVVNVFSTDDYILGFLYRSYSVQYGVAGLQAIADVKGIENVDVSDIVDGHTSYRFLTGTILKKIGFEDIDAEEVKKEIEQMKKQEAEDEKSRKESAAKERERPRGDGSTGGSEESHDVSEQHVKDLEREIEEKNQQSYVGWAQENMVAAGVNVNQAYQRATAQWNSRRESSAGQVPTGKSGQVDATVEGVKKQASDIESPAQDVNTPKDVQDEQPPVLPLRTRSTKDQQSVEDDKPPTLPQRPKES